VSEPTGPGGDRTTGGLLRASGVMAVGTVASRVTGLVRNVAVVTATGTLVFGDAYNVANTVPNILYILLAGGAINSVFVPQLVRHLKEDPDGGRGYAARLVGAVTLVLAAVSALAVLAAPWVVRPYVTGEWTAREYAVAVLFARFCLPQILFYGLYTMYAQLLNSRQRFGAPMFAPVVNNVVVTATAVLFVLVVGRAPDPAAVSPAAVALLGVGTTLGIVAQAAVLVPLVRAAGFPLRPRFDLRGAGLGKAGDLAGWTIGYVLVNQLAYLVVTRLATAAGKVAETSGVPYGAGYTVYVTAFLIFQLPHSVATVSLVTALLPRMSRHASEGRLDRVRADLLTGVRLAGAVLVPAAALLVPLGGLVGQVLFPGLELADARIIGWTTAAFALGLVPFSLFYVLLRGFYAQEDTRTPALINLAIQAADVGLTVLAFLLLPPGRQVVGMAAAYALSYLVGLGLGWRVLHRRLGGLPGAAVVRLFVRLGVAGLVTAGAAALPAALVVRALGSSWPASVVALATGGLLGAAGYLLVARLLRVAEVRDLLAALRGRLP